MKRFLFSTVLAAAVALPASAFAAQRAVPRGSAVMHGHGGHGGGHVVIAPYYSGGWWGPAYGWGYYDPFWGYGWDAPYGYGYAPAAVAGGLRIEVTPKDAQVYADGSYAGTVDDFDGHFQHLNLTPGGHRIEIRAQGFAPLTFNTFIQPDHTTDYKGHLTPAS